jgi:proline dehydrogenase
LEAAKRVGLSKPLYSVIKKTCFTHFCGGENLQEMVPTLSHLKKDRIGAIVDLAVEADESSTELKGKWALANAVKNAQLLHDCVDIAGSQPGNFVAVKITAFVPPGVLLRWTNTLAQVKAMYSQDFAMTQKVTLPELQAWAGAVFPSWTSAFVEKLFKAADADADGVVDWLDLSTRFSLANPDFSKALLVLGEQKPSTVPELTLIQPEDLELAPQVISELQSVCAYAKEKKVRIMMDAEQTYFQPAIDDVALSLAAQFNEATDADSNNGMKDALIYNTYQLYLKDAYSRMVQDFERSKRLGHAFGVKLVRGAYMESERARAETWSYASPVHDTIEDTHNDYKRATEFLIQEASKVNSAEKSVQPLRYMLATHNKDSIDYAFDLMERYPHVNASGSAPAFAQLMGMQDPTTYKLASKGVEIFKYIPYGPVEVTIPYLHRRAVENSAAMAHAGEDLRNLAREIRFRLKLA